MEWDCNDDEHVFTELMEKEAEAEATEDEEHMKFLTCMDDLCAQNEKPRHGGTT
jgi:hypothetical protein